MQPAREGVVVVGTDGVLRLFFRSLGRHGARSAARSRPAARQPARRPGQPRNRVRGDWRRAGTPRRRRGDQVPEHRGRGRAVARAQPRAHARAQPLARRRAYACPRTRPFAHARPFARACARPPVRRGNRDRPRPPSQPGRDPGRDRPLGAVGSRQGPRDPPLRSAGRGGVGHPRRARGPYPPARSRRPRLDRRHRRGRARDGVAGSGRGDRVAAERRQRDRALRPRRVPGARTCHGAAAGRRADLRRCGRHRIGDADRCAADDRVRQPLRPLAGHAHRADWLWSRVEGLHAPSERPAGAGGIDRRAVSV